MEDQAKRAARINASVVERLTASAEAYRGTIKPAPGYVEPGDVDGAPPARARRTRKK